MLNQLKIIAAALQRMTVQELQKLSQNDKIELVNATRTLSEASEIVCKNIV